MLRTKFSPSASCLPIRCKNSAEDVDNNINGFFAIWWSGVWIALIFTANQFNSCVLQVFFIGNSRSESWVFRETNSLEESCDGSLKPRVTSLLYCGYCILDISLPTVQCFNYNCVSSGCSNTDILQIFTNLSRKTWSAIPFSPAIIVNVDSWASSACYRESNSSSVD